MTEDQLLQEIKRLIRKYDTVYNSTDKHGREHSELNGQYVKMSSGNVEKSSKRDKIKNRERKEVQLPKEEYAQVLHELNTNLPAELKNMKIFRRSIGNYTYKVQNNGFNKYKIIGKQEINEMFD